MLCFFFGMESKRIYKLVKAVETHLVANEG